MSHTFFRFLFVCVLAGGLFSLGVAGQAPASNGAWDYRLMATNKTSTMQKEMQQASDEGYESNSLRCCTRGRAGPLRAGCKAG